MLQTAGWAGAGQLSKTVTGFINMLLVAHLGIQAILIVTCTFMVTLIYLAIDQQLRGVTTPLISQCTSEKKQNLPKSLVTLKEHCKETDKQTVLVQTITVQALLFSMAFGFLVGGLALVFPNEILQLTGASNSVAFEGKTYCQIMIGSICLLSLSGTMEGTLEGIGQAKRSAQAGIMKNGTHLLFSFVGIYFLDIGVVGVALASIIGEVVGLIFMAHFLRKIVFQEKLFSFLPNWGVQKDVFRNAIPLMADMLFYQMNAAFLWYILQSYGDVVFASQRISAEIMAIPSAIFWGFYVSVSQFVPRAYGDCDYRRVKQYTTSMLKVGVLTSCIILSFVFLYGKQLAKLFSNDQQMITTTHQWIFIYVLVGVVGVIYNVIARALKAIQENTIILMSSFISNAFWCISLFITWQYMSLWSVATTYVLYLSLEAAIVAWYFYSWRWVARHQQLT
jgi:Na+-driven multidrug efflux pump